MSRFLPGVVALIACAGLTAASAAVPQSAAFPKKSALARPKAGVVSTAKSKKTIQAYQARPTPRKTAGKTAGKTARRPKAAVATRSYTPQQPSPERYQQIQQALVEKGYYKGEPNGQWNADSVDALKRFQSDQSLTSDGKLNSLSLIALGLGPKRMGVQSGPPHTSVQPAPATPAAPESGVRQ